MNLPPDPRLHPEAVPTSTEFAPVIPPARPKSKLPLIFSIVFFVTIVGVLAVYLATRPKAPQKITLTYWGLLEDAATIQPLIDEFQSQNPNITVDYISQSPVEYRERLQSALATPKGPDIFRVHNTWLPMFGRSISPTSLDSLNNYYPIISQDLVRSNRIYALPFEFDGLALVINEKLLFENNKPVPKSWDDLRQAAIAISRCDTPTTKCTPKDRLLVAGAAIGTSENIDYWQDALSVLMLQNGVNPQAPSGIAAQDVLTYFTNFVKVDHVWDNTFPRSVEAFKSGKVGIIFAPARALSDILSSTSGFKVGVHPIPQIPFDATLGEAPITWGSYWAETVSRNSKYPSEAWQFLSFLTSPESQAKLVKFASSSRSVAFLPSHPPLASQSGLHSTLQAYSTQAPFAKSSYLADSTYDGTSGINSQFSQAYSTAIVKMLSNSQSAQAVSELQVALNKVLVNYGLAAPVPTGR